MPLVRSDKLRLLSTTWLQDDIDTAFSKERVTHLRYMQEEYVGDVLITPYAAGHMIGGSMWKLVKETVRPRRRTLRRAVARRRALRGATPLHACVGLTKRCACVHATGARGAQEEILYAVDINHRKDHHLDGTELHRFSQPSVLILDAARARSPPPDKDIGARVVGYILRVLRAGGNVLLPVDTAGRVLDLILLLERNRDKCVTIAATPQRGPGA